MSTAASSGLDLVAQNEELWRVVEKQRVIIQNLQESLAKMTAERDRLLERHPKGGQVTPGMPPSQEWRSRSKSAENLLPARTPPPVPHPEPPEIPLQSPGPVPPPRSPYRQNSTKDMATSSSHRTIAHSHHGSEASDVGAKQTRAIPVNARPTQPGTHDGDYGFADSPNTPTHSTTSTNTHWAAESMVEKDAQLFAKYQGAIQRKEGSSAPPHPTLMVDPSFGLLKSRSTKTAEAQRKPSDPSPSVQYTPTLYDSGFGNASFTAGEGRKPSKSSEESTTPTSSRRGDDRRDESIAVPSSATKMFFNMPMANISVQVLGTSIITNSKGKEVISFTISVRRGPDAVDPDVPLEELWCIQKVYYDLVTLDVQLRSQGQAVASKIGKLPDKALFTSNAPNKADQRMIMVESYLQKVLSVPLLDNNDLCDFLSSNVIVKDSDAVKQCKQKQGYLTKRGKNFGGWKSRYFVLDEPVLKYYESEDGAFLGVIKLADAQIGAQLPVTSESGKDAPPFQHALMLLEPKKTSHGGVHRHILCAASDAERDEWVEAIKQYIEALSTAKKDNRRSHKKGDKSKLYRRPSNTMRHRASMIQPHAAAHESLYAYNKRNSTGRIYDDAASVHSSSTDSTHHGIDGDDDLDQDDAPTTKQKHPRTFWGKKIFASSGQESTQAGTTGKDAKPRGAKQVFGVPLEEAVRVSRVSEKYELPAIVYRCIEFLESRNAVQEEGLYRLSGRSAKMRELKKRFNEEGDVDLLAPGERHDVHTVAGLLKMWLRELPGNALTNELLKDFFQVIDLPNRQERVKELGRLVSLLPLANYTLLRILSAHLIRVVQNAERNKMTMRNVGIVFSATLGVPAGIFSLLLTDFDYIFWTSNDHNVVGDESRQPEPQTPTVYPPNMGPVVPKPQPHNIIEDTDRSNRNSVNYMHGAPQAIVGLEKRPHEPAAVTDEDGDETENFDLAIDEDPLSTSDDDYYFRASESSQAPSSQYEYHGSRLH